MERQDRQLDVLRAIVQDYVRSREPVGSRHLVERYNLGFSPATIRNDMAVLEEEGYIAQPHTSAGRIPTDKGYRAFVDKINVVKPLSAAERRAIHELLDSAVDLDDVLERTVRLLAQLTQQVAVVQYPSLRRSALRHVELVPAATRRLMIVIITDTGRVEQRTVEHEHEIDATLLAELRARLNAAAIGRRMPELERAFGELADAFPPEDRALVTEITELVTDTLSEEVEERIVMAGTANLARADVDFTRTISPVLEALEQQVVLLRLLTEMGEESPLAVRIGAETLDESLSEAAVVAGAYGTTDGGSGFGQVGIVGPTRMDYPSTMAAVRAVARYLSKILAP
jgi:heat-inducible transcriptional repressor